MRPYHWCMAVLTARCCFWRIIWHDACVSSAAAAALRQHSQQEHPRVQGGARDGVRAAHGGKLSRHVIALRICQPLLQCTIAVYCARTPDCRLAGDPPPPSPAGTVSPCTHAYSAHTTPVVLTPPDRTVLRAPCHPCSLLCALLAVATSQPLPSCSSMLCCSQTLVLPRFMCSPHCKENVQLCELHIGTASRQQVWAVSPAVDASTHGRRIHCGTPTE